MVDINRIIKQSLFEAQNKIVKGTEKAINRERSINFVESMASNFRIEFKVADNYIVFSKYFSDNKKDFGLNELLFDISVCRIKNIESPKHKTKLPYIEKALWIVESEMAKDTRQLVLDFSKLVMGDAENKLFVGPINTYNKEQLEIFKKIAVNCKGDVWVAMIEHPGEWMNSMTIDFKINKL